MVRFLDIVARFTYRTSNSFAALALAFGLAWSAEARAHDFWVQPNAFWFPPSATTSLTLEVGHGPQRQRSTIPLKRITRFDAVAPEGRLIALRGRLRPAGGPVDGDVHLSDPGTYVLALETDDQALSFLPAIRFNDYLRVEGLTPALNLRARTHRMDADGTENYSRRAKALVQVGPIVPGGSFQVTKPLGMSLEIVPEINPYELPRPASLPVRVIFENRPLAGALVKLTNLDHDEAPVETHLTDRAGRATFTMPKGGKWLLNVIWTKAQPMTRDTDFETTFSSLSFGWQ